ncbi:single-stranded DNA-binding protein [Alicyclobacillus dauci]|uniref:Single-stranded DNA-binding protein n=1 Tax=Alicyclobacillus dauci TaxID=1475485 RepID=A0ABY6Z3X7_9BACL|nr:single-stranded DNA-binding protein [Alicyclobacillus dauci]WAH36989.1 single-stranded DNA-binding protein [Alicyclobacillus dauci]
MLNRVILIGRLTQDPELRYTNSGTPVASFTLAVDRQMRSGQNGERQTDFINIVVWQKQAEIVSQYLQKGRLAAVDGRLQIRTYENREGQKVRVAEVVAESVRFLDRGPDQQQQSGFGNAPSTGGQRPRTNNNSGSAPLYEDDPFADDSQTIDISEDDLPF